MKNTPWLRPPLSLNPQSQPIQASLSAQRGPGAKILYNNININPKITRAEPYNYDFLKKEVLNYNKGLALILQDFIKKLNPAPAERGAIF